MNNSRSSRESYLRAFCASSFRWGRCEIPPISVMRDNETVWDLITFQCRQLHAAIITPTGGFCLLTTPSAKYLCGTHGFPPAHGKQWNDASISTKWCTWRQNDFYPSALWQRWSNVFRIKSVSGVAGWGGDCRGGAVNNEHHLLFWREFVPCAFDGKRRWRCGSPANLQQTYWILKRGAWTGRGPLISPWWWRDVFRVGGG